MVKTTDIQKILTSIAFSFVFIFAWSKLCLAADIVEVPVSQEVYDQLINNPDQQAILAQMAAEQAAQQPVIEVAPAEVAPAPVCASPMPTVANMDNPDNAKRFGQVAGTDQWNDLIYSHCMARGIDPVFVKAIMTVESGGNVAAKNGSYLGLYQVGKSFGYDSSLMLSDPDYQTEAAIDVIESKIMTAYDLGCKANIYYVAKFYNGSESYAKTVSRIYEDLNGIEGSAKTNLVKIF